MLAASNSRQSARSAGVARALSSSACFRLLLFIPVLRSCSVPFIWHRFGDVASRQSTSPVRGRALLYGHGLRTATPLCRLAGSVTARSANKVPAIRGQPYCPTRARPDLPTLRAMHVPPAARLLTAPERPLVRSRPAVRLAQTFSGALMGDYRYTSGRHPSRGNRSRFLVPVLPHH